ncbi:MAG: DegT/DnrJ/EryC1/StrS family aminotransferase [Acidimicrobiales bacterium]
MMGGRPAFPGGLAFARPLTPPLERVVARLAPSYDRGVLTNGPLVREFEELAAAQLGVAHAVAVASCTSGLMLALRALGVRGSAVLPGFTFCATAHAVDWNGLRPVFADCHARTFQLDPDDARRRLDGAGVLVATHVFGAPCPVETLESLAAAAGVPLVLDAAHAFGALRSGRAVGGFGDVEVFSLSPTKIVVAGEGGLVATNRDDIAESVRCGRDYGNPGDYDTRFVGLNGRLSELHAAVALESLLMLDEHLERRRALAAAYGAGLAELPGIDLQEIEPGDASTWKDVTVIVDEQHFGLPRDVMVRALRAEGIDVRCYFSPPVHLQRSYATTEPPSLPVTEHVAGHVVSLPVRVDLREPSATRVVEALAALHAHADAVRAADGAAG